MSGIKGKSGPRPKTIDTRETHKVLTAAGKLAASKLFDYIKEKTEKGHKVKSISGTRLKAYELAISHAIGTPRQRVEIHQSGELLTVHDLARLIKGKESPMELPRPDPELLAMENVIDIQPVEVKEDAERS